MNEGDTRVHILVVEDNPGDVDLMKECFEDSPIPTRLSIAGDGVEALEMLHAGLRPSLIFLDLNLPRKGDIEVLKEVKQVEDLSRIPVVVFTSSESTQEIGRSYELGANCHLTKPADLTSYLEVVGRAARFWSNTPEPPRI